MARVLQACACLALVHVARLPEFSGQICLLYVIQEQSFKFQKFQESHDEWEACLYIPIDLAPLTLLATSIHKICCPKNGYVSPLPAPRWHCALYKFT